MRLAILCLSGCFRACAQSCVTSQVFIKFWKKNCEKSPGFKNFITKLFQNFLFFLEELLEEMGFKNTMLYLFKPMQAILQREYLQTVLYKRKYALPTRCLKMNFKMS
jgi:hypothetical protein